MQTIRSFIAIPLPEEVKRQVARFVTALRSLDDDAVKWVPADNLHLTLKFLGDVDNRLVPDVCRALQHAVTPCPPFAIDCRGAGGFPDLYRARVLWVDVTEGQETLGPLVNRLETNLAELGFKREPRAYRAHLTIGRLKTGRRPGAELIDALAEAHERQFGAFTVGEVHLVASYLERRGATYTTMDRVALS